MKATKYFRKKADMTAFAKSFAREHDDNWFLRSTRYCDHAIDGKRPAIILITKESLVQRLILCRTCNIHGNSIEMHNYIEILKNPDQ